MPVWEHLFPDGLEVSVPYHVLSEVQAAQASAVWVAEELKETVLGLELTVCVHQLHVPAAEQQQSTTPYLSRTDLSTAWDPQP